MLRREKRLIVTLIVLLIILSVFLAGFFSRSLWLPWFARFLVIPENPAPSDVIIVLGGELKGERTERAVQLYKQGMAPRLLFSDGTDLSWRIRAVDEMTALARQLGVPDEAIYTEEKSRSTYENALFTKEILLEHGWDSAIVVTTDWHTRRSKMIFEKVYEGTGIKLSYASAKDKRFDSLEDWWRNHEEQQTILTEWAKLVAYLVKY